MKGNDLKHRENAQSLHHRDARALCSLRQVQSEQRGRAHRCGRLFQGSHAALVPAATLAPLVPRSALSSVPCVVIHALRAAQGTPASPVNPMNPADTLASWSLEWETPIYRIESDDRECPFSGLGLDGSRSSTWAAGGVRTGRRVGV